MRDASQRDIIKAYMLTERGHCDWPDCPVEQGLEMHEIFSRGRTIGNSEARERSFDLRICSLLCREHHDQAAGASAMLLEQNVKRYGPYEVAKAYCAVLNALGIDRVGITLSDALERTIYGVDGARILRMASEESTAGSP